MGNNFYTIFIPLAKTHHQAKEKNKPSNTGIHKRFHPTGKTIFNFQFSIFNELYP